MKNGDIELIELRGAPRARGRAYGESARRKIHDMLFGWRLLLERATGRDVAAVVADFLGATRFESTMARFTPWLLEEIAGIAEGAGVARDHVLVANCPDEYGWFLEHRGYGLPLPEPTGCSSLAIDDRGAACPIVAQNFDIPGATDGLEVLLRIRPDDSNVDAYLFTVAGIVGMIGLNRAGVGVVNNSLRQLRTRTDGLPVNMVVRGLLAQSGAAAAVDFLQRVPHATGHNYIVGGPDGVAMFECSANAVVRVASRGNAARLVHTNHPLASPDVHTDPRFNVNRSTSDTGVRLDALDAGMRALPPAPDVDAVKAVLRGHVDPANPVCRHKTDRATNFTAASVVYELSLPPVLHLAPGPPCETSFSRFEFTSAADG